MSKVVLWPPGQYFPSGHGIYPTDLVGQILPGGHLMHSSSLARPPMFENASASEQSFSVPSVQYLSAGQVSVPVTVSEPEPQR